MKNYLALIRKADFTDLYKYGHLHINGDMKTEFNVPVEDLSKHVEIFNTITQNANSFDKAFAYLIIHYTKCEDEVCSNDIYIEEVKNIYPLDIESKKNFEMSFDERIRIEEPIWKDAVLELQKRQEFLACKKGAQNMMKIIGVENSDFKCENFITDDIISETINQLFDDKRPSGEISLWIYLLRYERHSFYPKNTLGFFMDMVNVVCNRHAKQEVDVQAIKNTSIFQLLDSLNNNNNILFSDIYTTIQENASSFVELTKSYESNVDFIKIATLFLILRDKYSDKFYYEDKFIKYCINHYSEDFKLAIFMLGIVLGHNHTYDCLYESLPLAIFKVKEKIENPTEQQQIEDAEHKDVPSNQGEASEAGTIANVKIQEDDTKTVENEEPQKSSDLEDQNDGNNNETTIVVESKMNQSDSNNSEEENKHETTSCGGFSKSEALEDKKVSSTTQSNMRKLPKLPCRMGKLLKDGTRLKQKNPIPVLVKTLEEYLYYSEEKGYVAENSSLFDINN